MAPFTVGIYPSPFLSDAWNATGNPNIRLWAEAVQRQGFGVEGVDVEELLNPERLARRGLDLVHMNWPEAFFHALWADIPPLRRRLAPMRPMARRVEAWIRRLDACALPLVLQIHELGSHNFVPGSVRARLDQVMRRRLWDICAAVATQEESGAALLQDHFGSAKPVAATPLGDYAQVHGPAIDRRQARRRLGLDATGRVLGAVGTYRPRRNPDRVLKTFQRLAGPEDRLVIAGQGMELYHRIRDKRIRVLAGFLAPETMRDIYCALDVAINDCSDYFTSGVVRAALSYGLPVAAQPFGNTIDMARGAMVPIDQDDRGLETALSRCLTMSSGELEAMRGQARHRNEERTWDKAGEAFARLYKTILIDRQEA